MRTPASIIEHFAALLDPRIERAKRHKPCKTTRETRCFITSLHGDVVRFGRAVRRQWSIENRLHWTLDIAFDEDQCHAREDHAPENLAVLRHVALNLLLLETSNRRGVQTRRLCTGWDHTYLERVLAV